ncbi:3-deoxy-7-phosphoheptulonate synthase [bacterium]|nr:3-deoxy-7-phosphoheptulonate synthase [bacterium]
MIIVVKKGTNEEFLDNIKETLIANGMSFEVLHGSSYILLPVVGDLTTSDMGRFKSLKGVERIINISKPYFMVSKNYREKSVVDLGDGVKIGEDFAMISGPCSVESADSLDKIAAFLSSLGVKILRGGTFKMRTSPYSFQGLGENGVKILNETAKRYSMKSVSEIIDVRHIDLFEQYIDIIQVGARNMMNFALLKELGKCSKPILLKRSANATIDEFLSSAEYIMAEGNENIILCERGITSFDDSTRSVVNIAAIPIIKNLTHLPVILDPSHSVGNYKYVTSVSEAAVVLGADGLIIETHFNPTNALSDGYQSLNFSKFGSMYRKVINLCKFKKENP